MGRAWLADSWFTWFVVLRSVDFYQRKGIRPVFWLLDQFASGAKQSRAAAIGMGQRAVMQNAEEPRDSCRSCRRLGLLPAVFREHPFAPIGKRR
jgi:hypothetical protein